MTEPKPRENNYTNFIEENLPKGQNFTTKTGSNVTESTECRVQGADNNFVRFAEIPVKGAFMLFLALFIYLFCSELLKAGFPKIAALTFFASITLCYGIYVTEKWPKYIKFSSFELGGD